MQNGAQSEPPADTRHKCFLCSRTYERHDHLSRHLKSHDNARSYKCEECGKGFNRADLLNRHKAAHARTSTDEVFRKRTPRACEACIKAKTRCDDTRPCKRCTVRDLSCKETDGRKNSEPLTPSTSQAEPPFSFEALTSNAAQLEQVSPSNGLSEGLTYQFGVDDPFGTSIAGSDFGFPDFFEQIMMPDVGATGTNDHFSMPLNVADFTQDWTSEDLNFDFAFLESGLEHQPTFEGRDVSSGSMGPASSLHSDPEARSAVFRKTPWSWIPQRNHGAFEGQNEIDVREHRVDTTDQHVSPNVKSSIHHDLELESRDRMIRVVTKIAESRLSIPSFPSLQLLEDLVNICMLEDGTTIDGFLHTPSFECRGTRTELLLAMASQGSRHVALAPVWKMGLVLQEVVRLGLAELYEADNSTTRELQILQAFSMWLGVGVWSGIRRKTEIGISFLQPLVTMMFASNAFLKSRYQESTPFAGNTDEEVTMKWKAWVEQESFKRLVIHAFIHDSQVAFIHLEQNRLISPAQMMLPVPCSQDLFQAPDAFVWRNTLLTKHASSSMTLPSLVDLFANPPTLDALSDSVDKTLCLLASCHAIGHDIWHFRQQSQLLSNWQAHGRQDRWLGHLNRKKDLLDDLTTISGYCGLNEGHPVEVLFTVEFLTMTLHVSLEDILLFSGKAGEDEARRVYPRICAWTKDAESRAAIWSAGQVLRIARTFEKTRLRDFYALAVYQSTLTLWVFGIVTSHTARKSGIQTPDDASTLTTSQLLGQGTQVYLDDANLRSAKSYKLLGQGIPGLRSWWNSETANSNDFVSLRNHKGVMKVAEEILKANFPESRNGLPPFVENLANLMSELGKLSGK